MIRAVLDINGVLIGILSEKGVPGRILRAWLDEWLHLVTSRAILKELRRVLRYPKISRRHRSSDAQVTEFVEDLTSLAIVVPGELSFAVVVEDPSEDRYLECAVEGEAGYVVSGDRHLIRMAQYEGVEIPSPRAFLDVLS